MTMRKEFQDYEVEAILEKARVMPEVDCYVNYGSSNRSLYGTSCNNYGNHSMSFRFAGIKMWFSYKTMIAFQADGCLQIVRENEWGPTTGRHLQAAQRGYGKRYPEDEFLVLFADALNRAGIAKVPRLCVFEQKPKSPKRKMLRKIGLRKLGERVIAVPTPPTHTTGRKQVHPKKQTRLEKLASGFDFDEYEEEFPEEVFV